MNRAKEFLQALGSVVGLGKGIFLFGKLMNWHYLLASMKPALANASSGSAHTSLEVVLGSHGHNEEKQDSSTKKEGKQPEGINRCKVFKSLWVYVLY